ncbi:2Fe-2S iron-sulfur cluster-binding protein [Polaromonas sp.]|uniref:2Fe-2S iron-sulfur cluster-binding protein n=1 Tax=Polaromonas sp. TaxID=1869339 RepID=UPI001D8F3308|nr:2Fe-2S iron-sulfur cluster-binding protein [Polaromonas sp.]MBT9475135.1 (2Fe-2S)-binding protein [Polaromonas sp.]
MPQLSYISHLGLRSDIEVQPGGTVMQNALERGLAGINGDCGGACQCCTCHVYVEESWLARLPPMEEMEDAMLDCTAEPRRPNSRLSCMLTMGAELDGLVVHLPATQN